MSLFAEIFAAPNKTKTLGVVTNTSEFARIFSLPRRSLDLSNIEDVTPLFAKTGVLSFRPIQSAAIIEAAKADGLFAPIGVGWGKTLIGLALPEAFGAQNAIYLVKPDLKRQLEREAKNFYGKHFSLPLDRITVVSYSELSSAATASILDDVAERKGKPVDAIIADEAHCLRHSQAARTKRFMRFAKENPQCKFAFLSGTMTTRSIEDYAHLIELALRKNSPLPRGYRELKNWAGALDVEPEYFMEPGMLKHFCAAGESVREGFRRRLFETEGVVGTREGSIGTSLIIRKRTIEIPPEVAALRARVVKKWVLGDDIELTEAIEKARALKQLASGFYYSWDWPSGKPDEEWLDARREWNQEVRQRLRHASRGFDSPKLLAEAAENYWRWFDAGRPRGVERGRIWASQTWPRWARVKDRKKPPTKTTWISDYLVEFAREWWREQDLPAIIWYSSKALGERIAKELRMPLFDAGTDASESREPVIVASISTQGTGKNLQHYARNLVLEFPPNGGTVEQLIGRTHRSEQKADEVIIDWLGHTPELEDAMAQAIKDAEYMETTGAPQKLLYATKL